MKKQGFTLIELLAVIVILAIIALIATPIVLNIIANTKENAQLRSAEMYLDAVEQSVAIERMNNTNFKPNTCSITSEGNLFCEGYEPKIEVKVNGEKPTDGSITFTEGKITQVELKYKNGKTIIMNEKGKLVYSIGEKPVLLEGDGSTYNLFAVNDLRFRSSAPMDEFQEVQVNGQTVDPQYYTVSEGSTVINLSGEYLATLNADEHDIAIVSDAGAAEGTFSATEGIPDGCTYIVKATGEVLTGGDQLPEAPGIGDIYSTSDYEFHYWEAKYDGSWISIEQAGVSEEEFETELGKGPWYCGVKDNTKESYGEIPTSLFGKSIKAMTTVFAGCANMKYSPKIPLTVENMRGCYAFCTSLLEMPELPDGLSVGEEMFVECTSLTSITIPDSVTTIGRRAFQGCTSLTSVTISGSVTTIGELTFDGCTSLASVDLSSVTTIGSHAFQGCTSLTSITIPGSVTTIGEGAFISCTGLTSVTISDGVTSIDDYAFSSCSSLTSVTIPDSVTTIGRYAFSNSLWLTLKREENPLVIAGKILIDGKTCSGEVTIPSSVTTIGSHAFQGCTELTSITIPDSVTTIGSHAFQGCTELTSVTIPDSVTSIAEYTFSSCTSLTSVTIPDSVATIDAGAFNDCTGLASIYIPPNVSTISASKYNIAPFYNCSNLKIYCGASGVQSGWSKYWNYYASYKKLYPTYGITRTEYEAIIAE